VAWVDGAPIFASDVRQHLAGDGDRRSALREALRFELLAQEASRRGLDRDPAAQRMRQRALANLYVRRAFGDHFTPQSIPAHLVQRAYRLNWMQYDRPELVRLSYVVFVARAELPAERRRAAQKLAERAATVLRGRRGIDAREVISATRELVSEARRAEIGAGVKQLTVERLKDGGIKPVVDAAFAMRPGTAHGPISAAAGFYVVYLHDHLQEVRRPLAAVEQEIRARIFEDARRIAFEELVQRLEREHAVRLRPDALGVLAGSRSGER
jgi:hypothetical protein